MQGVTALEPPRTSVVGLWALLVAVLVALSLLVVGVASWDVWGAVLVGPVLVAVSAPMLLRQAEREHDRHVFTLLLAALVLKLGGSIVRYLVAFSVYEGVADASGYHDWGVKLANAFWHGRFATELPDISGANFIRLLTGVVYTGIGPTRLGGFLFFSWLGFLGLFLFYRAFTIAIPEGRRRSYAVMLFFLPSLMFWPSSIGKEAWMMFALGIGAFGTARILGGRTVNGVILAAIGLWLAALVRPHVAGIMAIALVGGFLFRRPRHELRQLGPVVKAISLAGLVLIAWILVVRTDRFLHNDLQAGVASGGITSVLGEVRDRTQQGGSSFEPSVLESPARAPVAAFTVLFRPLLIEAHNTQSLLAAAEGTFLLLFALVRFRWVLSALGSIRRQPYVAFAIAYSGLFIVGFSAVANFGLLARERVQLLPLFLILLSIPPKGLPEDDALVRG